jgi:hypothetical protein
MDEPTWWLCPCCDQLVELMDAVPHILQDHPQSGIAYAIRAEVDREWEMSR